MRNPSLKNYIFLLLAFLASLSSCKISSSESGLRGDLHTGFGTHANIMSLRPGESLEFCGQRQDQIQAAERAVAKWLTPIGRNGHLNINPCNTGSNLRINLTAINRCQGSPACNIYRLNLGEPDNGRFDDGTIEISSQVSGAYLDAMLLHELGHSFGLCDQYTDKASANCVGAPGAPRQDNREIMGATDASKQQLTQGDLDALQRAVDANYRSTGDWQHFLANASQQPLTPQAHTQQPITFQAPANYGIKTIDNGDGFQVIVPEYY